MLDGMAAPAMANARARGAPTWRPPCARRRRGSARAVGLGLLRRAGSEGGEYDVDTAALRPYFSLDRVLRDGVFFAAERLYGLTFAARDRPARLPPRRADLRGTRRRRPAPVLGLFVCDWFARPTKRGGAWMDEFVTQSHAARRAAGRRGLPERAAPGRGAAGADDRRRGAHRVPRVRPRAARALLRRDLPPARRHRGAARLRRVPLAGQRDVGLGPGRAGPLRPPPRHR